MKAFQLTLDENLIESVDRVAKKLGKTRSAFTRFALKLALEDYRVNQLENQHRKGYATNRVSEEEFIWMDDNELWKDV